MSISPPRNQVNVAGLFISVITFVAPSSQLSEHGGHNIDFIIIGKRYTSALINTSSNNSLYLDASPCSTMVRWASERARQRLTSCLKADRNCASRSPARRAPILHRRQSLRFVGLVDTTQFAHLANISLCCDKEDFVIDFDQGVGAGYNGCFFTVDCGYAGIDHRVDAHVKYEFDCRPGPTMHRTYGN